MARTTMADIARLKRLTQEGVSEEEQVQILEDLEDDEGKWRLAMYFVLREMGQKMSSTSKRVNRLEKMVISIVTLVFGTMAAAFLQWVYNGGLTGGR